MASTIASGISNIPKVLFTCIEIIDKIVDLVSTAAESSYILHQTTVIRKILEEIESNGLTLSPSVQESIGLISQKLDHCDKCIDKMFDRKLSRPRDILGSRHYRNKLAKMREDLNSCLHTYNATSITQIMCEQQGVKFPTISKEETGPIPGKPQGMKAVKRAHNRIMVQWEAPSENSEAISCYEVQYRRRWKRWENCGKTTSTQHIVDGLSADTNYWFQVRAVNTKDFPGRFCEEI